MDAAAHPGASTVRALEIQGHRGARGLLPENTLAGFQRALELGAHTLELDVAMSRDGHVVAHHDLRLNPEITRLDGAWIDTRDPPVIRDLTLEQLRRYEVGVIRPDSGYARRFPTQRPVPGARIPTLAEVIDLVARHGDARVRLNVEPKSHPATPQLTAPPDVFVGAVIQALRAGGMYARAGIQAFNWPLLAAVQRQAPDMDTGYLSSQGTHWDTIGSPGAPPSPWTGDLDVSAFDGSVPAMVRAAGGRIWSPDFRDLQPRRLTQAQALGLRVVVWTVNTSQDIRRMIRMGVDGVISDYPQRVVDAAHALGVPQVWLTKQR